MIDSEDTRMEARVELDVRRRGYTRRTHCKECSNKLGRYNKGPLCLHCEETRWDVSVDPFEAPQDRVMLHELNRIRHEQGISWSRLERLTSLPRSSLKNWSITCRLTSCPYDAAEKIAQVLGVTLKELKGE